MGSPEYKWRDAFLSRGLLGYGKRWMLSFDGVDDHVRVADSSSLDITDAITVEVWFKTSVVHDGALVWKAHSRYSPAYGLIYFGELAGSIACRITDSDGTVHYVDFAWAADGLWHHLAVTYDGSAQKIFFDSIMKNQVEWSGTIITNNYDVVIGDRETAHEYFNGLIASVRIYNRALIEDEIKWNYMHSEDPVRDGLVLWLKMNEGYGDTVYDLSGYGNHGTIYGASWIWDTAPSGLSPLLTEYPSLNTYSVRIGGTEVITKDRDIYANKIYGTVGSRELLSAPLRGLKDLKNVEFREDGIPIEKTLPEGVKTTENEETVNLSHTIGWLTQCIKELSDKVESLEQRIRQLEDGGGS